MLHRYKNLRDLLVDRMDLEFRQSFRILDSFQFLDGMLLSNIYDFLVLRVSKKVCLIYLPIMQNNHKNALNDMMGR